MFNQNQCMGRSQETFSKKEREKKRIKKRQEKSMKRDERKASSEGGGLDNMMAYVDEFGNILDTPPDTTNKQAIDPTTIDIAIPKAEDRQDNSPERKGRVAFFNEEKGYGFIKDLSSEIKYFVHAKGCEEPIKDHDKVSFELERGPKGLNAINVKKLSA